MALNAAPLYPINHRHFTMSSGSSRHFPSARYFSLMGWDWVHLVLRPLFGLLCQPRMIHDDDYRAIGGIRIGTENGSTRREPAPVPLCPPQIPHDLPRARTRTAAVGSCSARYVSAANAVRKSVDIFKNLRLNVNNHNCLNFFCSFCPCVYLVVVRNWPLAVRSARK
jgi:hypothetical protein